MRLAAAVINPVTDPRRARLLLPAPGSPAAFRSGPAAPGRVWPVSPPGTRRSCCSTFIVQLICELRAIGELNPSIRGDHHEYAPPRRARARQPQARLRRRAAAGHPRACPGRRAAPGGKSPGGAAAPLPEPDTAPPPGFPPPCPPRTGHRADPHRPQARARHHQLHRERRPRPRRGRRQPCASQDPAGPGPGWPGKPTA